MTDDNASEAGSEVNVEFDFVDPTEGDFHSIKRLLNQLFDTDSQRLDLSALSSLIIRQTNQVGSLIKTLDSSDDNSTSSGDTFAVISVINSRTPSGANEPAEEQKARTGLFDYLLGKFSRKSKKSAGAASKQQQQQQHPHNDDSDRQRESMEATVRFTHEQGRLGVVLLERFLNMPADITPPLLRLLHQELQWCQEDSEDQFKFDYLLLPIKMFRRVPSQLTAEDTHDTEPVKKPRLDKQQHQFSTANPFEFVHDEDEIIANGAVAQSGVYLPQQTAGSRSTDANRVFSEDGLQPARRLLLLKADCLTQLADEIERAISNN